MLTPRENLLKVFRHEVPEWLPLVGHCDPYNQPNREGMDPELVRRLGTVHWRDTSTVTYSRWLGLDIMDWFGLPGVSVRQQKIEHETTQQGDETTHIWHTPGGDLRGVTRVCRDPTGAVSSLWTEHPVKEPRDLETLAAIFADKRVVTDPQGVEATRRRQALVGDGGIVLGVMEGTPLGMMFRVFCGVVVLAYLYADAPQALHDCFKVMERHYLEFLLLGAQTAVDAIVSVDDTSTTAISPTMFEEFNMALTDERADAAHAAGKLYLHHSCGHIKNLLPLYRRTKMDGVHAFTTPPKGDVTIAEGHRLLGRNCTIITGVKQLDEPFDDRALIKTSIKQMIREGAPFDHLIFNVCAYPRRTMEQTAFVVDCCREAGAQAALSSL